MKFIKIKRIEKTETKPIYHMVIEKNHNFFGNNLCLHNCDYYGNEGNDGNIAVALGNRSLAPIFIEKGEKVVQAIFTKYLLADNDNSDKIRAGGIGSTNDYFPGSMESD